MKASQANMYFRQPRPVYMEKGRAEPTQAKEIHVDYTPDRPLGNFTLKQRAKHQSSRASAVQMERNHPVVSKMQPPDRNVRNSIYRRYTDGTLDYGNALGMVSDAARKYTGGIALTENDALVLSSVFGLVFSNLPLEVVKNKAFLTTTEAQTLGRRYVQGLQAGALSSMS